MVVGHRELFINTRFESGRLSCQSCTSRIGNHMCRRQRCYLNKYRVIRIEPYRTVTTCDTEDTSDTLHSHHCHLVMAECAIGKPKNTNEHTNIQCEQVNDPPCRFSNYLDESGSLPLNDVSSVNMSQIIGSEIEVDTYDFTEFDLIFERRL